MSQLSQTNLLISDSFVRGGEEGSGSGHSPNWESDDDDGTRDSWTEEEGSGNGKEGKLSTNLTDWSLYVGVVRHTVKSDSHPLLVHNVTLQIPLLFNLYYCVHVNFSVTPLHMNSY